ncbi:hypothetical protein [Candidatus Nanohalococcus occultus]|uniref:Transposase n=1 Tax=Candidatus Nanohalococcus occultus TaxID=2978047 RepID=A0ABY8CEH8_9ARCH|nr:hypothetical protein SVXNc_0624 [Candidatus Nanohaloarchaeota archaeon SVXNc]
MKIEDYSEQLNSNDVARQRYGMFKVFEILVETYFEEEVKQPVERLREEEGYMYKLTQDFLSSSQNYVKRQKLEKIADFVGKKLPEEE